MDKNKKKSLIILLLLILVPTLIICLAVRFDWWWVWFIFPVLLITGLIILAIKASVKTVRLVKHKPDILKAVFAIGFILGLFFLANFIAHGNYRRAQENMIKHMQGVDSSLSDEDFFKAFTQEFSKVSTNGICSVAMDEQGLYAIEVEGGGARAGIQDTYKTQDIGEMLDWRSTGLFIQVIKMCADRLEKITKIKISFHDKDSFGEAVDYAVELPLVISDGEDKYWLSQLGINSVKDIASNEGKLKTFIYFKRQVLQNTAAHKKWSVVFK